MLWSKRCRWFLYIYTYICKLCVQKGIEPSIVPYESRLPRGHCRRRGARGRPPRGPGMARGARIVRATAAVGPGAAHRGARGACSVRATAAAVGPGGREGRSYPR